MAVQGERLKVAKGLPDAPVLADERLNFRVKINIKTAHDSYEAWREVVHDDMVLSVALACWTSQQYFKSSEIEAHQNEMQKQLDDEFSRIMGNFEL